MYTERLDVAKLQSPNDYQPAKAYARAKRAQVVLAAQLDARLGGEVVFHSMHPGWAATPGVEQSLPAFNKVVGPLFRDAHGGGDTVVWLLASEEGGERGGQFWLDRHPRSTTKLPNTETTPEQAMALWAEVVELGGIDQSAFAPTS
jgi:NAD(P)-dependent dehydrogenase (short-subunit alcohol dehydrogenase family)